MELMIGEKLKKLRRSRDLTQEEVAVHLGISFQAISKWERGDKAFLRQNNRMRRSLLCEFRIFHCLSHALPRESFLQNIRCKIENILLNIFNFPIDIFRLL